MARLRSHLPFSNVLLIVNAWKGVASVQAPGGGGANDQMLALHGLKFASDGSSGDAKSCEVRLRRIVKGTGTGTPQAVQKLNNALSAVPRAAGRVNFTAGQNGTDDGSNPYLGLDRYHPQGGLVQSYEFSDLTLQEGTELLLEIFVPTGGNADSVSGHWEIEE